MVRVVGRIGILTVFDAILDEKPGEQCGSEFISGFNAIANNIEPFRNAKFENAEPAQFEVISEGNPCQS